eukprot:Opistho-2@27393
MAAAGRGHWARAVLMPLLMALAVCTYSSHSILSALSQRGGRIHYNISAAVFVTEFVKLVASIVMASIAGFLARRPSGRPPSFKLTDSDGDGEVDVAANWISSVLKPSAFARLALPAVLYAVNNNIAYHAQREMDAASFVVLCNFKIVTTALLFRVIMRKHLTQAQWAAMPLLVLAGALNGYSGMSHNEATEGHVFVTTRGAVLMLVYCGISGLAGVYSEKVLKTTGATASIHAQNIPMYILGVAFNGFAWWSSVAYVTGDGGVCALLRGFNLHTWAIVATQAANGILLSIVMKHASSIAKLFVVALATALGTVLAITLLGLKTDFFFVVSLVCVLVALALYNRAAWANREKRVRSLEKIV